MTTGQAPSGDAAHEGLVVRGVSKRFGGTQALADVDLDVRPGEVMALLGENGAGKSTLSAHIAGIRPPDAGTMRWRGDFYTPQSPGDAIAAGIGLIHQEIRLLPHLSVAENVFVGRMPGAGGQVDWATTKKQAAELLARVGLDVSPTRDVGSLPIAAQQQIEIAKALALDASLLILDEPTAALGTEETERLFDRVVTLREHGVSFIYITHRLEEVARIADRVTVLRDGEHVAAHETGQVPGETLVEQMVGRSIERLFPEPAEPTAREVLRVEELSNERARLRDISFAVHAGEVFGIAGIVGAGRTELARTIVGADSASRGRVLVDGEQVKLTDMIRAGVVLVPEDRKDQGLLLDAAVDDNLVLASLDQVGRSGWVWPGRVRATALQAMQRLGVRGNAGSPMSSLSGGNQQKVVIAKWLQRSPRVVILDEPTRGIDIGARESIYQLIADLAAQGTAVIVISSELDEVLGLSNRVLVLSRGRQRDVLDRADADEVAVMSLATT